MVQSDAKIQQQNFLARYGSSHVVTVYRSTAPCFTSQCARMSEAGDDNGPQLRQLSAEVDRIARQLAKLSAGEELHTGPERREGQPDRRGLIERRLQPDRRESPDRRETGAPREMLASIRAMIRARRLRDQFFSGDLFADPAWDMLLDLLLARIERRPVAVSSLCIAAAVPPTTALRWIKRLTEEGIFIRTADPHDGRRVFIDLSSAAADGMIAYIRALERIGFAVP